MRLRQRCWALLLRCGVTFWDTADVYGAGVSETRIGRHCAERPGERIDRHQGRPRASLFPHAVHEGEGAQRADRGFPAGGWRRGARPRAIALCAGRRVAGRQPAVVARRAARRRTDPRFGASVETIDEALFAVQHPGLTSIQIIFNLVRQDPIDAVLSAAVSNDVGVIVRLPLASGVLSGKMTRLQRFAASDHRNYNRDRRGVQRWRDVLRVAVRAGGDDRRLPRHDDACGHDDCADGPAGWILDQPAVTTVIAGATRPARTDRERGMQRTRAVAGRAARTASGVLTHATLRQHIRGTCRRRSTVET